MSAGWRGALGVVVGGGEPAELDGNPPFTCWPLSLLGVESLTECDTDQRSDGIPRPTLEGAEGLVLDLTPPTSSA
jgi:hypothetical protein